MPHTLKTEHFLCEYSEGEVSDKVIWESHCHTYYEMILVLEGEILVSPEGRRYRLGTNDAVILPQLVYHTVRGAKKSTYRRLIIQFDPSFLPSEVKSVLARGCLFFSSSRITELYRAVREEKKTFFAPLCESLIIELLYTGIAMNSSPAGGMENDSLSTALRFIDENLCKDLTLDEIALVAMRSKSSFCRIFKQQMKITPKQYILQKRLATAQKHLEEGGAPTLVAEKLGYHNYSDFYRIYKKHFGTSPKNADRHR